MPLTLSQLAHILSDMLNEGVDEDAPVVLLVGDERVDADQVWLPATRFCVYIQDEGPGFGNKED